MTKQIITSALLYANGPLHFGHLAGAYLPADCYARFLRLQGDEVLYLSGSDEFGVPITLNAELAGCAPQAYVDRFHALNDHLFRRLDFSFDHYARTTWPKHAELVNEFFRDLCVNGFVEERTTEQLYSDADERFLADRYVMGICPLCGHHEARGDECPACGGSFEATDLKDPRSKLTGAPLDLRETRHWFLLLDKLKSQLDAWLEQRTWKPNVLNFARHYLKDLRPRAITRDGAWGVPVPEIEGKVFYVWFEAPIGYLSAAREWSEKTGQDWKSFWCDPQSRLTQFIGKDNIFFHALFFPAMTMGQSAPYKLVDDLPANEFLLLEGRQFSKSEGWFIDLDDFLDRYAADQVRYVLAANAPESSDSEFTFADFQQRCNSELMGKYGNLANRVLLFAQRKCGGRVPPEHPLREEDRLFLADVGELVQEIAQAYREHKLRRACQLVMEIAARGNVYFDGCQPWKATDRAALEGTIRCSLLGLRALALASSPIIPGKAQRLWEMLGYSSVLADEKWGGVLSQPLQNGVLPVPEPLFARVEDAQIAAEKERLVNST